LATLCALAVFVLVIWFSKIVSVSSIVAGIAYPLLVIFVFQSPHLFLKIFSIVFSLTVVLTHHKNISRLVKGEEPRASFLFKQKHG
jgi:glycerol-3-phosphate acyltransferase PlsY